MLDRPATVGGTRVGAVVTAFNPASTLVDACRSLTTQVDLVVVVDDGSGPASAQVLDACRDLGARVVRHGANLGIGAALNTGAREVHESIGGTSAACYVLTLDQDSVVPSGYVDTLLSAARAATQAGLVVGMVGPGGAGRVRLGTPVSSDGVQLGQEPIQSGLLIPSSTFDAVGMFDSSLFIDGVDSDFYLRAATAGLRVVVAPTADLGHQLGREHVVTVLGRRVALVHAAEFRYYYIARNRVTLLRRHFRRHPRWAARALLKDLRHLTLTTALVPGRRVRLANTVSGIRDGVRGVSGRRREP